MSVNRDLYARVSRGSVAVLLLASQLALGSSVHHHSSNLFESVDRDESASPRQVHEVDCPQPTASHWHPDRIVGVEPCLACLRQHLLGIQVHAPLRPVLSTTNGVIPARDLLPLDGLRLGSFPRGPPTLL